MSEITARCNSLVVGSGGVGGGGDTFHINVEVIVTLRLAAYRQLVSLCAKPLENHDQRFFLTQNIDSSAKRRKIKAVSMLNYGRSVKLTSHLHLLPGQ
jgi:hypothetical protein